jgi:hypothetical protein
MARRIYDGEIKVQWVPGLTGIADPTAPTIGEINAGSDVTEFLQSLDTPLEGEAVPSMDLSSAYRKTVAGPFGGEISTVMYREDEPADDLAFPLFTRNTTGYFVIRRFGGSLVDFAVADVVEVWPVRVITRSPAAAESAAVQSFTANFAGLDDPQINVDVVA